MIDFLIWSGVGWALISDEGMANPLVSSDGLCVSIVLDDFRCKECSTCAWVSTYCREVLQVQCTFMVTNESELEVCLLMECEGFNTS